MIPGLISKSGYLGKIGQIQTPILARFDHLRLYTYALGHGYSGPFLIAMLPRNQIEDLPGHTAKRRLPGTNRLSSVEPEKPNGEVATRHVEALGETEPAPPFFMVPSQHHALEGQDADEDSTSSDSSTNRAPGIAKPHREAVI